MPKDNPFSDNPFGVHDVDPFAAQVPTAPPAQNGNFGAGGGSAWGANNGGAYNAGSSSTAGAFNVASASEGTGSKAERLDLKEKELAAKEVELKKWEENLRSSGQLKPKKNWPRCFPLVHHDIPGDIPAQHQRMVRMAYWSYLAFFVCITFNWFASLMALCVINPGDNRLAGFLMACVYWFAALPGAWVLWYKRLYNAAIKDRAFTYAWFFLFYLVHIGWCIWAAVSPPIPFGFSKWALAGYVAGIKAFGPSIFVGVVFVVGASFWALEALWSFWVLQKVSAVAFVGGASFWSLEALWSFWVLQKVYRTFRTGGGTAQLKQEAASGAVKASWKSKFGGSGKASKAPASSNLGAGDV